MSKKLYNVIVIKKHDTNTLLVKKVRRFIHPIYKKVIVFVKKYLVHNPNNKYKCGDIVNLVEVKPISKKKAWRVM